MIEILISLFIPIILGAAVARLGYLPKNSTQILNSYLFNVSIPVGIFLVISSLTYDQIGEFGIFIIANFLAISFGFVISFFLLSKFVKDKVAGVSMMIAVASGNVIFFGFPVARQVLGPQSEVYTAIYTLPFFLAVSLVGLVFVQSSISKRVKLSKIFKNLAKNPIIHANLLGIIFLVLVNQQLLVLSDDILQPLRLISNTTVPLALFTVGFYLSKNFSLKDIQTVLPVVVGKFVLIPLIALLILIPFGLNQEALKVSILLALMPTATLALVLTDEYKLNSKISAASILATSLLFFLMLPLIIILFNNM